HFFLPNFIIYGHSPISFPSKSSFNVFTLPLLSTLDKYLSTLLFRRASVILLDKRKSPSTASNILLFPVHEPINQSFDICLPSFVIPNLPPPNFASSTTYFTLELGFVFSYNPSIPFTILSSILEWAGLRTVFSSYLAYLFISSCIWIKVINSRWGVIIIYIIRSITCFLTATFPYIL